MSLTAAFRKRLYALKHLLSMVLVATMIGVSNIIMEEDRSVNDTRARIEQGVIERDEEE